MRNLLCFGVLLASLTVLGADANWQTLEATATSYVKDSSSGSGGSLDRLQAAITACAAGPLPEAEAKDKQASVAWTAVQNAAKALDEKPQDSDTQKAFWASFQDYLWAHAWWRLNESAAGYISAKAPDPRIAELWLKKFGERVASRAETTGLGHDEAAQSVVLDWMNDHEKLLASKQPEAILEACRIFCWAHMADIALPALVLEGLQKDNRMTKFAKYLDEQAAVKVAQKQDTN